MSVNLAESASFARLTDWQSGCTVDYVPSSDELSSSASDSAAEVKATPNDMAELHRLANLGRMVAGVSHDLNNLLGVVRIYSEMASAEFPPGERLWRYLNEIGMAVDQGATLLQRLMEMSSSGGGELSADSLNRLLCEMQPMLHCIMDEHIRLSFEYGKDLPPILADPIQLQQAILNLALNAKQAMPEGGELRFSTQLMGLAEQTGEIPAGEYVTLSVSDSGIGLDPAIQSRIFEPFFTTRAHAGGTGLGLTQVAEAARRHRGFVLVNSTPGEGSRFSVLLPPDMGQSENYPQPAEGEQSLF